uniref:Uncharacterized protein n=2 Tax=Thermococcus sp. AMT7 TaxID=1197730 RepID=L0BAI5_9EURY|nr:hypothetical protein a7-3 [Thermococcus sp. AMT7]
MAWIEVVTNTRPHTFGVYVEKGFIDLSRVEEVQVQKLREPDDALITLLDKDRRKLGSLNVPTDKAYEIAHKIMNLINLSKEGKVPNLMIKYREGVLLQYSPNKNAWEPLKI